MAGGGWTPLVLLHQFVDGTKFSEERFVNFVH